MRTYRLVLECYDDGHPVLMLTVDQSGMTKEIAKEVVEAIFKSNKFTEGDE